MNGFKNLYQAQTTRESGNMGPQVVDYVVSATTPRDLDGAQPDERAPLLGPGHGPTERQQRQQQQQDEEQTVVITEVSGARLWVTLAAVYLGVFLGAIDTTIIATLSAPISSEFRSLSLLSWLAAAYLIANAACQPVSGRLTDIFGRGAGLVFSNIFFAAGNLICGLAQSSNIMILGRVVAGVGGGGLMSISTFVASDLVPLRKRGIVQGIGNICFGSGAMLGGVIGGLMNDTSWGWRLAFLIQVPIVVVSGLLVFFLVRIPPKSSRKSYLARIDFVGVLLITSFLVILLLGLNSGGNLVPWTHPLVLTTLPLAALLLLSLIVWESRNTQPIIPVRLLAVRTISAACMTNLVCTMANTTLLFYIPVYLQVQGYSPTQSGLRILFGSLGVAIGSFGCGIIMKKTGRYSPSLGICVLSSIVVGAAAFSTLDRSSPGWVPFPAFILAGAGYGGMLTITMVACVAAVDHSQQAVITSATYAFRSVGATLGITVASVVYQNILKARLWERLGSLPGAAAEIRRIRDDLDELNHLPDGWRDDVIESFMEAFRGVWLTVLGLALLGLAFVSLMKQQKLHSDLARRED